ncbi:hypothetical protein E2C01_002093 [Portunus trituberculatus]|uniref:Uncharacterized protein n=1 Tax=Portunus trituberculatus TaxID=210409 RepID=A0A5B7CL03_PORTR|nr:hypothetical protein [Portunus trituberculatus]
MSEKMQSTSTSQDDTRTTVSGSHRLAGTDSFVHTLSLTRELPEPAGLEVDHVHAMQVVVHQELQHEGDMCLVGLEHSPLHHPVLWASRGLGLEQVGRGHEVVTSLRQLDTMLPFSHSIKSKR